MRLGDHPELFAAIMQALADLSWASSVTVGGSDNPRGYRVTVTTGDRFLTHSRTIIVALNVASCPDIIHTVRCQIDDIHRDLDRVVNPNS